MAASGPQYFYEDEVFRVLKSGDIEFGMVTENWEMYSSDEESDPDKVPTGSVAVTWHPKGKDEVLSESKVKLSDRSLMPGDVVRRLIAGKDTQRGYCRSVKVSAAVQIMGTKKVIPNVVASDLLPVQKLQTEIAVYLDSWIGVIRDMHYRLSLRFTDGSACTIDSLSILDHFEDTRRNQDGFGSSDAFYPGQKLSGAMRYLKDADWTHFSDDLKRAKDRKVVTVTVTDVKPTSMSVQWQWQTPECTLENTNNKEKAGWQKEPPADLIEEKDLKRVKCLNLFESCTVQLGDISFYTPSAKDVILDKTEWKKNMATSGIHPRATKSTTESNSKQQESNHPERSEDENVVNLKSSNEGNNNNQQLETKEPVTTSVTSTKKSFPKVCTTRLRKKKLKKTRHQSATNVALDAPVVVETLHTQSTVDVVWQDGTMEEGMLSIALYPIHHLDDHEFFPGDFVVRADSVNFRTYGVIQNMDHNGRVALVKWFEAYGSTGDQLPKEMNQEEMSVYDIKDHPDYRFRPGTIVIRVANVLPNQYSAGQILDNYPDGQVRVWWANGVTSSCWPQDLFRLGDYDSDDGDIWDDNGGASDDNEDDDIASSDSSWETEAEEELNETDAVQRYHTIGKLIEHIQKTLVCIRETIIASTPVTVPAENQAPTVNLSLNVDRRGITKKLLLIYKDCQYLDKIMGSKFFDEGFLKGWFKQMEATSKTGKMTEQVSKLFELPEQIVKSNKVSIANNDSESVEASKKRLEKDFTSTDPENHILEMLKTEIEQVEDKQKDEGDVPSVEATDTGNGKLPNSEDEKSDDSDSKSSDVKSQTMFVTELCSVILTKLLAAHKEYESRFGVGELPKTPKGTDSFTTLAAIAEEMVENHPPSSDLNTSSSTELATRFKELCVHTQELATNFLTSEIKELAESVTTSSAQGSDTKNIDFAGIVDKDESSADLTALFKAPDSVPSPPVSLSAELGLSKDCLNNNITKEGQPQGKFSIVDNVPDTHRYRLTTFMPQNSKNFLKTVQKEIALLQESLPEGIFVKGYEDRMDLFSVMICGVEGTPYEDGIFLFDIQLPPTYPSAPPSVHYVSFCPDRLNPNLYECGKVCVSLLGTWSGKGTEVWTSSSSLLQLLISIQGLILVPEPYYNEAGYEKQRGSQQGEENSRMYNEMVLIKLVQSLSRMYVNHHAPWDNEINQYICFHHCRLIDRYQRWLAMSEDSIATGVLPNEGRPGFPLLPVSKGFSITLKKTLDNFAKLCDSSNNSSLPTTTLSTANPPVTITSPTNVLNGNVVSTQP